MQIKDKITNILLSTQRKGIEDLLRWMDENGFFVAPCSSKYHLAQAGGLAKHTFNVWLAAYSMIEAFYIKQNRPFTQEFLDSVVICTMLHDLGKTGQFGKPAYKQFIHHGIKLTPENINDPDLSFMDVSIEYETNKDLLYIPHEVRSIAIASQFIELTEEEQHAILYHNGLYSELQSIKNHETELYMLLHFADMWASRVIETEEHK